VSTIAVCTSRGMIAGFGTFAGAVQACPFDATRRVAAVFRSFNNNKRCLIFSCESNVCGLNYRPFKFSFLTIE